MLNGHATLDSPADGVRRGELALHAVGVTKGFPGVLANDAVELRIKHGEIHGLLGQNGSGKTTLCKILTGLYRPDAGEIYIDGQHATVRSPADAFRLGVAMVHQHFSLVDRMSVAENVVMGWQRGWRVSKRALEAEVRAAAERFGIAVRPEVPIWQLAMGERQQVEILKALYRGAKVLILDEPTAVLAPQEVDRLFGSLRELVKAGGAVVFISHKFHEVVEVCNRVSVLSGGKSVGTLELTDELDHAAASRRLASMMMGREITAVTRGDRAGAPSQEVVLSVSDLVVHGDVGQEAVKHVGFEVRRGEILGIAGVSGNGQRELVEAIYGLRRPARGTITLAGELLGTGTPRTAIAQGVAYVPEDRSGTGLIPAMTVKENVILKKYRSRGYARGPLIRWDRAATDAQELIDLLEVKATADSPVATLSGGNAQKVLLGREMGAARQLLVIAAPTRGLDFAATAAVRRLILKAASDGTAVVLVSEDLDELMDLADRVAVMCAGEITGTVDPRTATVEETGLLMMGQKQPDAA